MLYQKDCLDLLRELADDSVDCVVTSPPYFGRTLRYEGNRKKMSLQEWADWMAEIVTECCRVATGYVLVITDSCVRQGEYQPANETLMLKLYEHPDVLVDTPIIWSSNKPPTRRGRFFKHGYEHVLSFKSTKEPYFDYESIGEPPKYKAGGAFRQRNSKGVRIKGGAYPQNKIAVPYDVVRFTVGGGHLSLDSVDETFVSQAEAPFPIKLAQYFIKAACPPGGVVLDPFLGSGTTALAAETLHRKWIGCDSGKKQLNLAIARIASFREQTALADCVDGLYEKYARERDRMEGPRKIAWGMMVGTDSPKYREWRNGLARKYAKKLAKGADLTIIPDYDVIAQAVSAEYPEWLNRCDELWEFLLQPLDPPMRPKDFHNEAEEMVVVPEESSPATNLGAPPPPTSNQRELDF